MGWSRVFSLAAMSLMLFACSTPGVRPVSGDPDVQRPMSEQGAATERQSKARIHVELGSAYLEGLRFGTALDESKVAIAYDSTYAPAHLLMARVYAALAQHQLALPAFELAARHAPGDPEINNAFGWYLCSRGRETDGLPRLDRAARNPYFRTPERAYINAGLCYLRINNDAAAEQQLLKAVQIDGGANQAIYHLAAIALRAGNLPRAREWLLTLQKRMPSQTAEVVWLALRLERKQGNAKAEAEYAEQLRRNFAASEEYKALLQGKFE